MYNKIEHQKYQRYYRLKRIFWYFNNLLASSQGGAWEQLIRSVHRLLFPCRMNHKNTTVNHDALRTMLSGAQRILNARARPLTHVSSSVEDCEAISPTLIQSSSTIPTISDRSSPLQRTSNLRLQACAGMRAAFLGKVAPPVHLTPTKET